MASSKVDKKLEACKKKLLDLGMRNKLLNYKDTKSRSLVITAPSYDELYNLLVTDEKPLTFTHISLGEKGEEVQADLFAVSDEEETGLDSYEEAIVPGDIETNKNAVELQRVLKIIRGRANTIKEEQGVNTLFLSIGFLEWKESEASNRVVSSPIVLVPVQLIHEGIIEPYKLALHEDEIVVNPTLLYKLEESFGITLPAFDSANDKISDFLDAVRKIASKTAWNVTEKVSLSLMSFLKINMYKDIENHAEKIAENPIIKALSGEKVSKAELDCDIGDIESINHDNDTKPIDIFQVVDADSSQMDAIMMSKKGTSFVLQGPPGTGKSQTITNIIAEALADGKKVLFVSEKMAALDVVYKRLSASGLSDFCLVLHSSKANKKEILESLRSTLELKGITTKNEALFKLQTLEERRKRLNDYCTQLHTKVMPLEQSLFEANGEIARLQNCEDVAFELDDIDVKDVSRESLNRLKLCISDLANAKTMLTEDFEDNSWRGCIISHLSHDTRHTISSQLSSITEQMPEILDDIQEINENIELNAELSFENLAKYEKMLRLCSESKTFPKEFLGDENISGLMAKAKELKDNTESLHNQEEQLSTILSETVFIIEASTLKKSLLDCQEKIKSALCEPYASSDLLGERTDHIMAVSNKAEKLFSDEQTLIANICKELHIEVPETEQQVSEFLGMVVAIESDIRATDLWFNASEWCESTRNRSINSASDLISKIKAVREEILSKYSKEIFNIDANSLLVRFKTDYTSFFARFKGAYKQDCNSIRAYSKETIKKLPYEDAVQILEKLHTYHEAKEELQNQSESFKQMLGGWFSGEDTNFERISQAFNNYDLVRDYFRSCIPSSIRSKLVAVAEPAQFTSALEHITEITENQIVSDFKSIYSGRDCKTLKEFEKSARYISDNVERFRFLAEPVVNAAKQICDSEKILFYVNAIEQYQALRKKISGETNELRGNCEYLFSDEPIDWDDIISLLAWIETFKRYSACYDLPVAFQRGIATDEAYAMGAASLADKISNMENNLSSAVKWFNSIFEPKDVIWTAPLKDVLEKAQRCLKNIEGLEAWIDFCRANKACIECGLGNFASVVLEKHIEPQNMDAVFTKRFQRLWIDSTISEFPAVESFRTYNQEKLIKEFRVLDQEQLKIARTRIRERLIANIPNMNTTSAQDEVGILKRELSKKSRIMPLRKLFDQIPFLLPVLKPCMMMSPLSVSHFLQSASYEFDMVIFDEASQVCTENAIGAISRGKQLIVAGDRHQLPPTSFFNVAISDSEDFDTDADEEYTGETYESVLDELLAVIREVSLKWHYRSRNESLITFSNAKIYNNSLITFPTPSNDNSNEGVEFVYVEDGIYDRGRKRNNIVEAKHVAQLVFTELQSHPERSIGVIAFSEAQQGAIDDEVTKLRLANPQYEEFFNENNDEAFFIKNLENVQGDERDTIIFSIGYAKTAPGGKPGSNFGPINRDGGYRRLNVAITRAKYAIKVVSSVLPTDIAVGDASPRGVRMLRDYLDFAKNGVSVIENELNYSTEVNTESPFEDSVYEFLTARGYGVVTQVGCSGYRIDMAIKHPTLNGKFVIGIECDGAAYHSSRTARERDRLRQSVLEGMGWSLYRIWSTDWIKDPISEGNRLCTAIDRAIENYGTKISNAPSHVQVDNFSDEKDSYSDVKDSSIEEATDYGFEEYRKIILPRAVYEAPIPKIETMLSRIVQEQSPVHMQLVYEQLAPMYCNSKVTDKVRNGVNFIVKVYATEKLWEKRGDFLWTYGSNTATPRKSDPTSDSKRNLQYVAAEELSEAMKVIAAQSYGITKDNLFKLVCREYGFNRRTAQMDIYLENAYAVMLSDPNVKEADDKVVIRR